MGKGPAAVAEAACGVVPWVWSWGVPLVHSAEVG